MGKLDTIDPAWAWAAYEPGGRLPWNLRLAGHLMRRVGFGADWPTLQRVLGEGPQRAVARLLRPDADVEGFHRGYDQLEADSIDADSAGTQSLRQWWLRRMILSPHPLLEKMTLFWHSHFGVSGGRVGSERLVQRHIQLLRRHALGSFRTLLEAACRDPAVLLNAGVAKNLKSRPSEHLARVLLECYTLGPGTCSPADLSDAARALTGYAVLRGEYRDRPAEHDAGEKRFLGEAGPLTVADVLRIALQQAAAPEYLVRKLFAWLVSETEEPPASLMAPLARMLAKDYDVGRVAETMLRSNLFYSPTAYRQRIKGPIEFALGIARGLGELVPTGPLGRHLDLLGQNLCQVPTVHGWSGGTLWLNRVTLVERSNVALAMLAESGVYEGKLNPGEAARKNGFASPDAAVRFLVDLFVQGDVPSELMARLSDVARGGGDVQGRIRRLAHAIVTLPEFQLG